MLHFFSSLFLEKHLGKGKANRAKAHRHTAAPMQRLLFWASDSIPVGAECAPEVAQVSLRCHSCLLEGSIFQLFISKSPFKNWCLLLNWVCSLSSFIAFHVLCVCVCFLQQQKNGAFEPLLVAAGGGGKAYMKYQDGSLDDMFLEQYVNSTAVPGVSGRTGAAGEAL